MIMIGKKHQIVTDTVIIPGHKKKKKNTLLSDV